MLILTRKPDDSIVIDGRIHIKILRVRGGSIRVGISAPEDVRIRRGELAPISDDSKNGSAVKPPTLTSDGYPVMSECG